MSSRPAAALADQLREVVADERVLEAIARLPRERFVPAEQRAYAYDNVALPIGAGQTISQPLVVARMLELLAPAAGERILDIGTGSGYHAALLARLGAHVWTIERHGKLSTAAQRTLAELGIANVTFVVGDGSRGLPSEAPFDTINVAAAADAIPRALVDQLSAGGRLVVPEGGGLQHLVLVRRTAAGITRERHEAVRFVPLVRDPDVPA